MRAGDGGPGQSGRVAGVSQSGATAAVDGRRRLERRVRGRHRRGQLGQPGARLPLADADRRRPRRAPVGRRRGGPRCIFMFIYQYKS